jgi:hypothetical protein
MTEIRRLESDINVAKLVAAIKANPELWKDKTFRQDFEGTSHADTETIFLRWAPKDTAEEIQNGIISLNFAALSKLEDAEALMKKALKAIGAQSVGRAIIVSLKPGGKILAHADEGKYADTFERFHLCLESEGSNFFVKQRDGTTECCQMKPGELWWFNHKQIHWAYNQSKTPRIHMIIDAVAPLFRRERGH